MASLVSAALASNLAATSTQRRLSLRPSRSPCLSLGASTSNSALGLHLDLGRLSLGSHGAAEGQQQCRRTVVAPEARRVCDLTGKRRNNGYSVSFSNKRTKKVQEANLQVKRLWWEEGKRFVRLKLSTKAIKTLEWKGLQRMAKEAGIDLSRY